MSLPKSIGFPRMMKEAGEKRVFLPEFMQYLTNLGFDVYIEEGYGSRSGFTFDDYRMGNKAIHMTSREEAFNQDIVLVLRSPREEELTQIKKETILISMLHYPTRPQRLKILKNQQINSISLDSIIDDNNIRLIENMKAVAWNGLEAAFDIFEKRWPLLKREGDTPWHILILGTGMVGKYAVDAATKLGNIERNNDHIRQNGPGAIALTIGRNTTTKNDLMRDLFLKTDILVDATQRRNTSQPVVPNEWIAWLPDHAIITDLAVDPYLLDTTPPVVRGIEGIPQGNLDKYSFFPDDAVWDNLVPDSIPSSNRRTTVTCYSWPGIHPEACMRHYAQQLEPLMDVLAQKGYQNLSITGSYFERALYRATLHEWVRNNS